MPDWGMHAATHTFVTLGSKTASVTACFEYELEKLETANGSRGVGGSGAALRGGFGGCEGAQQWLWNHSVDVLGDVGKVVVDVDVVCLCINTFRRLNINSASSVRCLSPS